MPFGQAAPSLLFPLFPPCLATTQKLTSIACSSWNFRQLHQCPLCTAHCPLPTVCCLLLASTTICPAWSLVRKCASRQTGNTLNGKRKKYWNYFYTSRRQQQQHKVPLTPRLPLVPPSGSSSSLICCVSCEWKSVCACVCVCQADIFNWFEEKPCSSPALSSTRQVKSTFCLRQICGLLRVA